MTAAKVVALSAPVKKMLADFAVSEGKVMLSNEKFESWYRTFKGLPEPKRAKTASELIAVALRFEREGGAAVADGAAQLYFLTTAALTNAPEKSKGWK